MIRNEASDEQTQNSPVIIGIAGNSAVGKTLLAHLVKYTLGEKDVEIIEGDAAHKWRRASSMWHKYTHLHPQANFLHTDTKSVQELKTGKEIHRRRYDHASGTFSLPRKHEAKRYVIYEGLHTLLMPGMRQALDLKIYIKPDEGLSTYWKIRRDTTERGYSSKEVLKLLKFRESDAQEYIHSQESHADIVFMLSTTTVDFEEASEPAVRLSILYSHKIDSTPFIKATSSLIKVTDTAVGPKRRIDILTEAVEASVLEAIAKQILPELYRTSSDKPLWSPNHLGLMQLFTAYAAHNFSPSDSCNSEAQDVEPEDIKDLLQAVRAIGSNPANTQGGGGNISIKLSDNLMAVKASGLRFDELTEHKGFVGIDYRAVSDYFLNLLELNKLSTEEGVYEDLLQRNQLPLSGYPDTDLKPSMETGFHALLNTVVIHTHSVYVNILTCSLAGKNILSALFPDAAYIPYTTPGTELTQAIRLATRHKDCSIFFLENHGLIISGATVAEVSELHEYVNTVIMDWLDVEPSDIDTTVALQDDNSYFACKPSLTTFLLEHRALLTSYADMILFPDQIVYGNDIGFDDPDKNICIDTVNGTIRCRTTKKEALAIVETYLAWLYIVTNINQYNLNIRIIPRDACDTIKCLPSEKYRQHLLRT